MEVKSNSKKKPKSGCYCSLNLDVFKSRYVDYESILQIDGLSDVSLMGNDNPSEIHTSKVLLNGLGPKFRKLLQDATIKLDHPFGIVQAIHDFTLSGVCKFGEINMRGLLMAAKEFNIIGIRAQGGHYLVASTNLQNAHEMYPVALELLCPHTSQKIKELILENFEELGQNEDFLQNCKPAWMKDFIKDEYLNASEENVFNILVKWAQYHVENEQAIIKQIVRDIQFELMDLNFFNAVVKTCPFLQNNSFVQDAELSAKNTKLRPRTDRSRVPFELVFTAGNGNLQVYNPRTNRWGTQNIAPGEEFENPDIYGIASVDGKLVVIGSHVLSERYAYCMDLATQTWTRSPSNIGPYAYDGSAVVALGGKVYTIGGLDTSTVEVFDHQKDEWKMVRSMNRARWYPAAVAFDNKIIVLGGEGEVDHIHQSIEMYDPESDTWTLGPDMCLPRHDHKAVVLNNWLYAFGGTGIGEQSRIEKLDLRSPNARWTLTNHLFGDPLFWRHFGATVVNHKIMLASFDPVYYYSEETNQWTCASKPMGLKSGGELNARSLVKYMVTVKGLPNRKDYK